MSFDRVLLIFLLTLSKLSCSRTGQQRENQASTPEEKSESVQVVEDKSVLIGVKSLNGSVSTEESCIIAPKTSIGRISEPVEIDGEMFEWPNLSEIKDYCNDPSCEGSTSFKVAQGSRGYYIGINGYDRAESVDIILSGYYLQNGQVSLDRKERISLRDLGRLSQLVEFKSMGNAIEIFLDRLIVDQVQLYSLWSLQLVINDHSLPAFIHSSQRNHIDFNEISCASPSGNSAVRWYYPTTDLEMHINDLMHLLRFQLKHLEKAFRGNTSINILSGELSASVDDSDIMDVALSSSELDFSGSGVRLQSEYLVIQKVFRRWLSVLAPSSDVYYLDSVLAFILLMESKGKEYLLKMQPFIGALSQFEQISYYLAFHSPSLAALINTSIDCSERLYQAEQCVFENVWDEDNKRYSLTEFAANGQSSKHISLLSEVRDLDGDGLPGFLERLYSLDDRSVDSDHDGWSDLAEFVYLADGTPLSGHPSVIVEDGIFDDWHYLIPSRIHKDKLGDSKCNLGDIISYSAIDLHGQVIIGAELSEKVDTRYSWRINIRQGVGGGEYSLLYRSGKSSFVESNGYIRNRAFQNHASYMELISEAPDVDDLEIKVFLYKEDVLCDEVPWFKPWSSS